MKREERGDDLLLLANANRCKKQEGFRSNLCVILYDISIVKGRIE